MGGNLVGLTVNDTVRIVIPSNFRFSKIPIVGQTHQLSSGSNLGMEF